MKMLPLATLLTAALSAPEAKRNIILTVPLLSALDANRDGVISAEEIDNAAAALKELTPTTMAN